MPAFSRRDFLKLSALVPAGLAFFPLVSRLVNQRSFRQGKSGVPENIFIILFDAMSARNLSVYGYPRATTPNFTRFAERATVYHSHYSAGNFTTPGTTSLLTGLYPWTHRAINEAGLVTRKLAGDNIFRAMGNQYKRVAFAQNIWANFIVNQFNSDIDIRLAPGSFSLAQAIFGQWFQNDIGAGYRSFDDFLFKVDSAPASLVFGTPERLFYLDQATKMESAYHKQYPKGLPHSVNYPIYYRLEDVFNGVIATIKKLSTPSFAYIHMWPPHAPYRPNRNFLSKFNADGYQAVAKPIHPLSDNRKPQSDLDARRVVYDGYIANIDFEFGRLLDAFEQAGILDKSVIVLTADHGEMFERGEDGHDTPLMYDPILHIPLIIAAPGQQSRVDIFDPTNSVDVLPTLLHLAGLPIPAWSEGRLLPGLGGETDPQRSTFSVEAKLNPASAPLKMATIAMRKGPYKLIHYMGYGNGFSDAYEMYNLDDDLEEMNDLYQSEPAVASPLKEELLSNLDASNSHFRG